MVDSTEGPYDSWARTSEEVSYLDCNCVSVVLSTLSTISEGLTSSLRIESGVIYSIYVVLDVAFPGVSFSPCLP